jgi:hypothetical protein
MHLRREPKLSFSIVALIVLGGIVLLIAIYGAYYRWNFQDLGIVGDFYGGIANAGALFLLAYGLHLQNTEYQLSVREFQSQSESLKATGEIQMFNNFIDIAINQLSSFEFIDQGTAPHTPYSGSRALLELLERFARTRSKGNFKPIQNRSLNIGVFANCCAELIKFIEDVKDPIRQRTFRSMFNSAFLLVLREIVSHEKSRSGDGEFAIGIGERNLEILNRAVFAVNPA